MADSNVIPCAGLHTDPSAVVPPLGGMRRAVNVVIDAPGVATARPNFTTHTNKGDPSSLAASCVPYAITTFGERVAMISRGVGADDGDYFFETDQAQFSGGMDPPEVNLSPNQFAKLRRNLYFTTEQGVFKYTGVGIDVPELAGMHAPGQLQLLLQTGTADWFPAGEFVAYRVCFVKVDSNGVETRSPPTSWTFIENTGGAARHVVGTLAIPPYAVPGDTLEVYRSLTVPTAPPADSMFLALVQEVQPLDVTQGFIGFVDETPTEQLGQMLYTSAGREGIESANNPPPISVALAAWNDSMWTGATTNPPSLAIDLMRLWVPPAVLVGSVTVGSPVWTVSGPATNVRPGQVVLSGFGAFPTGTHVLSVVGSAVTMDADSAITSGAASIQLADVFVIDGLEYYGSTFEDLPNRIFEVATVVLADPGAAPLLTARSLAAAISRGSGIAPGSNGPIVASTIEAASSSEAWPRTGRILMQRADANPQPIVFDETLASVDAFDPVDPVEGFTGPAEHRPHRIAYSKPMEPEHFRLLDWIEMGREDAYVLAFAPLAMGLLVFKQDGVWSVSGSYPTFAVDKVSEAVLIRGGCVDTFEDVAYAWTDRGLLAMSERGTMQSLSDGKIREDLRVWLATVLRESAQNITGNAWLACWDARSLVLIGSAAEEDDADDRTYCVSTLTGEWSTWDLKMRSPTYDERTNALIYGRARDDLWELRTSLEVVRGYDHEYLLGGMVAVDTTVTVDETELNGWQPRVGDWIRRAEIFPALLLEWRRILAVTFSGPSSWILTIDATFVGTDTIADVRAREGAGAVLEWQRHGLTPPSNAGFIRELQLHLDVSGFSTVEPMGDRMRVIGGAHSDRTATLATLISTPAHRVAASRPIRFGVPRMHARSTHLYPYFEVNEGFRWRCLGSALVGEVQSSKLTRGVP